MLQASGQTSSQTVLHPLRNRPPLHVETRFYIPRQVVISHRWSMLQALLLSVSSHCDLYRCCSV